MIIRIDQSSETPLYLQIRDQLVAAIARKELLPGDGLPSVRRLASDLGINLHTVNKAYAVLRDEGYLIIRGRSGAYVADAEGAASQQQREEAGASLVCELQKLALEHRARGGAQETFVAFARQAAQSVYADPGIAGPKRTVGVLGVNGDGDTIGATGAAASAMRRAKEA